LNKKNPKLSEKLAYIIYEWSNEFKNDPALSLISSLYNDLKAKGVEFKKDDSKVNVYLFHSKYN
jgi:signal transducing adaptor molecule